MTVNVVHPDGGWSTTMINQTSGNRRIDASGRLRSSSLTLVNAASNETWTGVVIRGELAVKSMAAQA